MKKFIVLSLLLCSTLSLAQEETTTDFKKNELKGNALFLVLGSFDVSYERILNEESGVGISVNITFGKKPAVGFFGEAFGMLNNVDDWVYEESPNYSYEPKTLTDFALGIGLGGKWVTKKGLLLEINAGVGRNLFNNKYDDRDYELIGRAGITVGYRF